MELHRRADGALSPVTAGAPTAAPAGEALALDGVHKRFGATVALRDAALHVRRGTVHALVGENGAGKTTLMNVAFGLVHADAGTIRVATVPRAIASPADAIAAGLGMVHQHFMLVPAMTVAENVALGRRGRYDLRRVAEEIRRVGEATGMRVDPLARVSELSVAAQQRVEIVKALTRDARVLILDEPTAVLAPREATELLEWARRYVAAGNAVVLITHKLREALTYADEVTALRRGAVVLSAPVQAVTADGLVAAMLGEGGAAARMAGNGERELGDGAEATGGAAVSPEAVAEAARVLVGSEVEPEVEAEADADADAEIRTAVRTDAGGPPQQQHRAAEPSGHHPIAAPRIDRAPTPAGAHVAAAIGAASPERVVLRLTGVSYRDDRGVERLADVSLDVHAGELLGVAGVEGAGQHELLRLLAGRLAPTSGRAELPSQVGFVPEDRHRDALALDRPLYENVLLRGAGERRGRLYTAGAVQRTADILRRHDVRADGPRARAGELSGGNQQKLVLGRELEGEPAAIVAESPTRGLDVRAGAAVLEALQSARARGAAVVVYSADLDELLALADRVVVVHAGRLRTVARTRESVGHALLGTAH